MDDLLRTEHTSCPVTMFQELILMLSFHGLDVVLFSVFVLFGLFVFGLLLLVLGVFVFFSA